MKITNQLINKPITFTGFDGNRSEHLGGNMVAEMKVDRLADDNDRMRERVAKLEEALKLCFKRLEAEWPDGNDGRDAYPRTPGLIREAKDAARAALP